MGDQNEQVDRKITQIVCELEQGREDERNAENQIVQIIGAAGAVLGVVFASTEYLMGQSIDDNTIFGLSVVIFCIALTYITALGIKNVLRYHYLQELEDRLASLIPAREGEDEFMHWMSFSSPITTRNIKHLKSKYSVMHYVFYGLATMLAIGFCAIIIFSQYLSLKDNSESISLIFYTGLVVMIVVIICFIYFSVNAKTMYDISKRESITKKQLRKQKNKNNSNKSIKVIGKKEGKKKQDTSMKQAILYFVYPKIKDLQKMALIYIGFISGEFFRVGKLMFLLEGKRLTVFIITIVVMDVLVYQARYQWNDIRGVREDIEGQKKDRLPVSALGPKRAVKISTLLMFVKLAVALFIIKNTFAEVRKPLLFCSGLIILTAFLYEEARMRKNHIGIFAVVSMGYPLRFLAGMWTAYPDIWRKGSNYIDNGFNLLLIIGVLLASYALFGEMSVILPWTHEAVGEAAKAGDGIHSERIKKSHHRVLFRFIESRCKLAAEKDSIKDLLPLREKGKAGDPWNVSYILSIALLSGIILIGLKWNYVMLFCEIILVVVIILLCRTEHRRVIYFSFFAGCVIVLKGIYFYLILGCAPLYLYVCFNQMLFTILYFSLRYLFDPSFSFIVNCIGFIIGKDTIEYLEKIE